MSNTKDFDDFCGQYDRCNSKCILYNVVGASCRSIFDNIQEYLEKED